MLTRSRNRTRTLFLTILLAACLALVACERDGGTHAPADPPDGPRSWRILALGDSYTVGSSVRASQAWPRQLADSLAAGEDSVETLDVVASLGWTTTDLIAALSAENLEPPYDLVTLMIGVNNQFQGLDIAIFTEELAILADMAVSLAGEDKGRVLLFSIPDYGVTPFGMMIFPDGVAGEIGCYNSRGRSIADSLGLTYLDITPLSCEAEHDPALVAPDGLHYSGEMYHRWVEFMLPTVRTILARG
jgi:acyl-CoA thioesterase-1